MIEMWLDVVGIAGLGLLTFSACGGAVTTNEAEAKSMDAGADDLVSSNASDTAQLLIHLPDGFDFDATTDAVPPRNVCLDLPGSAYYGDGGEPRCDELKMLKASCENGAICGGSGTCAEHCVCVENTWCCRALAC